MYKTAVGKEIIANRAEIAAVIHHFIEPLRQLSRARWNRRRQNISPAYPLAVVPETINGGRNAPATAAYHAALRLKSFLPMSHNRATDAVEKRSEPILMLQKNSFENHRNFISSVFTG